MLVWRSLLSVIISPRTGRYCKDVRHGCGDVGVEDTREPKGSTQEVSFDQGARIIEAVCSKYFLRELKRKVPPLLLERRYSDTSTRSASLQQHRPNGEE